MYGLQTQRKYNSLSTLGVGLCTNMRPTRHVCFTSYQPIMMSSLTSFSRYAWTAEFNIRLLTELVVYAKIHRHVMR